MRLIKALVAIVGSAVLWGAVPAPPAAAYPSCYYSYSGCYLHPGWYDGYYWGGGRWWGWQGYGPNMPMPGCPLPYETGACG